MKKILVAVVGILAVASLASAEVFTFKSYSAAGATNTLNTCAVLKGKAYAEGTFDAETITNVAIATKAGSGTYTAPSGYDYKILCFQTASPKDAVVVQFLTSASASIFYPLSTFLFKQAR